MHEGFNKTVLIIIASVFILILYASSALASIDCGNNCNNECVDGQYLSGCVGGCGVPCQSCTSCLSNEYCNGGCVIGKCGATCTDDGDCSGGATCATGTSCTCVGAADVCVFNGLSALGDAHCASAHPSTPNCCGSAGAGVCRDCCNNADCSSEPLKKTCTSYVCVPEFPTALVGIIGVAVAVLGSVFIPKVVSKKKRK